MHHPIGTDQILSIRALHGTLGLLQIALGFLRVALGGDVRPVERFADGALHLAGCFVGMAFSLSIVSPIAGLLDSGQAMATPLELS